MRSVLATLVGSFMLVTATMGGPVLAQTTPNVDALIQRHDSGSCKS